MTGPDVSELFRGAVRDMARALARLPGRQPASGPHEVKELGPALRESVIRSGISPDQVNLNQAVGMANWNRPTSQVDLVVRGRTGAVEIAAELKAWDIGHQLFD